MPSVMLTNRFDTALLYASQVHGGQKRKATTIPYIAHLLAVTALVLEDGGDEDQAIAALLHDALEDQGGRPRLDDIRARFGDVVAGIVEGCTDAETIPKPEWVERKRRYIKHLRHASSAGRRVSLADKLHNARAILLDFRKDRDALWSRFNGGKGGTLWYYGCLVNVFQEVHAGPMTDELTRTVKSLYAEAGEGMSWPKSEDEDPPKEIARP
jgi:(p)ppGpp synthase/HD superfamily hydrolase